MHPAIRTTSLITALLMSGIMPGFIDEIRAQTLVGLKVSPTVMQTRIKNIPESVSIIPAGPSARLAGGIFVDIPLQAHYTWISTGIEYRPKVVKYSASRLQDAEIFEKNHVLQYLEIPVTLKLITDEFALDKRIYTEFGLVGGVLINHEQNLPETKIISGFKPYDLTLRLGAGVQFQLGFRTALELGLSYGRGLVNISKKDSLNPGTVLKNSLFSLDLGFRY